MEPKQNSHKVVLTIGVIVVLIFAAAFGGWYFFLKKSAEGGVCTTSSKCQSGLTCANKICSSGALNSSCETKDQCKTGYCVQNKCTNGNTGSNCATKADCKTAYCVSGQCTEGKVNDACITYKDCNSGLLCQKGACITPPDYSKYFSKVIVSKIKPGLPPGPENPTIVTNTFSANDSIEVDFVGVKPTTIGDFYFDLVDSNTGELAMSLKNQGGIQQFNGHDRGVGTSLNNVSAGAYGLNIYFNDELVYSTSITVQ